MSKTVGEIKSWLIQPGIKKVILIETQNEKYLSSKPYISASGINYIPCIKGGVSFTESINLDGVSNTSYGDIELDNTNGLLDSFLYENKPWKNAAISIYIGDSTWPREDFALIFTGLIAGLASRDRNTINITIVNILSRLNVPVTEKVIQDENGSPEFIEASLIGASSYNYDTPLLPTVENTLKPVLLGECFNVTPVLVSESYLSYNEWLQTDLPNGQVFLLNDAPIEGIIEVRDNGAPLVEGTHWDYIGDRAFALYTSSYGNITCSAQGYKGSAAWIGYLGSGYDATSETYAETIASTIKVLLTQYGGENKLNETDLLFSVPDNTPYTGYYCVDRENVLDVCNKLATSGGYSLVATTVTAIDDNLPPEAGKVRLVQIDDPGNLAPETGYAATIPDTLAGLNNIRYFRNTNGIQHFQVPQFVNYIYTEVRGAGGGGDSTSGAWSMTSGGGRGGKITGWLETVPGESLTIIVGEGGRAGANRYSAGGGGGYSAIKRDTTWLIAAGGGGGSGGATSIPEVTTGVASRAGGHTLAVGATQPGYGDGGIGNNAYDVVVLYNPELTISYQLTGYSGSAGDSTGGGSSHAYTGSNWLFVGTAGGGGSYGTAGGIALSSLQGWPIDRYRGGNGGYGGGGAGGTGSPNSDPNILHAKYGGGGGGGGYIGGKGGNNDGISWTPEGYGKPGQGGWNYVADNSTEFKIVSTPEGNAGAFRYGNGSDGVVIIRWEAPDYINPNILKATLTETDMLLNSLKIEEVIPPQYSFNLGYCKNWTVHDKSTLAEALVPESVPLFTSEYLQQKIIDKTAYIGSNAWLSYQSKVPPQENTLLNSRIQVKTEIERRAELWGIKRYVVSASFLPNHIFLQLGDRVNFDLKDNARFSFLDGKIGLIVKVERNWLSGIVTLGVLV